MRLADFSLAVKHKMQHHANFIFSKNYAQTKPDDAVDGQPFNG